jgi:hypothetical protein
MVPFAATFRSVLLTAEEGESVMQVKDNAGSVVP